MGSLYQYIGSYMEKHLKNDVIVKSVPIYGTYVQNIPINDILRVSLKPVPDLLQFVKLFIIRNSPNNTDKAAVNYLIMITLITQQGDL